MKNIILCGFMGCGKTTVGTELSAVLHMPLTDMDQYIENQAGMSVNQIFAKLGEASFRQSERRAARELSEKGGLIIATGGGAVLDGRNVDIFRGNGRIVFIDVPLDAIRERLAGDTTRPLLNRPGRDDALARIYAQRIPFYRAAADFTVFNPGGLPAREISEKIASFFGSHP